MSTLINLVFVSLGSFAFSFILWKKLKEDYTNESIFSFGWILLLSGLVGYWVGGFLSPLRFWIAVFPPVLLGTWAVKKMGFKLFELTDAVTPAFTAFLFFSSFSRLLLNSSYIWAESLTLLPSTISFLIFLFFLKKYRSFSWYPSGKVGFPGLASLGVYFLLRSVAMYLIFMLPFFGKPGLGIFEIADTGVSLTLSLTLWTILYLRSGRNLANRLNIWQK